MKQAQTTSNLALLAIVLLHTRQTYQTKALAFTTKPIQFVFTASNRLHAMATNFIYLQTLLNQGSQLASLRVNGGTSEH